MKQTMYVEKNHLRGIQYFVKKHDLRFEHNPLIITDQKAEIKLMGAVEGFNSFNKDIKDLML